MKICIIYDNIVRPDTVGEYWKKALIELGHEVTHIGINESRAKQNDTKFHEEYELFLRIDDDFNYPHHFPKEKSAYVIQDGHRLWGPGSGHPHARVDHQPYYRIPLCERFANIFISQKHIAEALKQRGFDLPTNHLPAAADPNTWKKIEGTEKKYDWCHVGTIYEEKKRVINAIKAKYPNCYIGSAPPEKANEIINQSKIAINISFGRDIPMRIFELMMAGTFFLTPTDTVLKETVANPNDWAYHCYPFEVNYFEKESLLLMMETMLKEEDLREKITEQNRQHALKNHTYQNRVKELLLTVTK